jgi:hypothetical protein
MPKKADVIHQRQPARIFLASIKSAIPIRPIPVRKPKFFGLELTTLNLTAEFMMYIPKSNFLRSSKMRILKVKSKEACTIAGTGNFLITRNKSAAGCADSLPL